MQVVVYITRCTSKFAQVVSVLAPSRDGQIPTSDPTSPYFFPRIQLSKRHMVGRESRAHCHETVLRYVPT
jgi:hypothetical protein